MPTDRDQRSAASAQIRVVEQILRRWDPIGVIIDPTDPDNPLDEYDSYAPAVLGKLQAGAGIEELTQHLYGLTTRMGLHGDESRDRLFAAELVSWWVDTEDRSDAA
jgi:hypothetical protein